MSITDPVYEIETLTIKRLINDTMSPNAKVKIYDNLLKGDLLSF